MFGCVGRIIGVFLLAGVLWAAWTWGPGLAESRGWGSARGGVGGEPVSEALAERAAGRLAGLIDGSVSQATFSSEELESLARFRYADAWPLGVSDPGIHVQDGEIQLSLRVASEWIPVLPELESIRGILPDTVPLQLRGRILTLEGGDLSVMVHRIEAASVPIPRRLFGALLEPLRLTTRPGLPPEALLVPLPAGIRSARIEGASLIVERSP
jgi:hypothetical protein